MKLIIAIIRPEMCQPVKNALRNIGVNGMTITHVLGRGLQGGIKFTNRVGDFIVDELEKTKIEIVIEDDDLEEPVVDTIRKTAVTGSPGDGRIMVINLEKFIRIRDL
jgi:nitrogen regulatory protein P-II 1